MKKYYIIDGDNNVFDTLRAAKYHIEIAYTPAEQKKYLHNSYIVGMQGDKEISQTKITVTDKGVKYGKTEKLETVVLSVIW